MHTEKSITIVSNRRKRTLSVNHILYIHMRRKHADIYMDNGEVIETRTTYKEFCDMLGFYDDGHASEAVVDLILEKMKS